MGSAVSPRCALGSPARAMSPLRVRRLGRMPYAEALQRQEDLLAAKLAGGRGDDLLLVEHDPVYTLGRGADERDLCGAPARLGVPVFRVGRGGGATYHGPGQMVAYPIVHLRHGRDVHRYVRSLERALIAALARFGVAAQAVPGETGVWTAAGKIASIGIGVRRGVSFHGVALNVSTDLDYFRQIVPCAAPQTVIVNLAALVAEPVTVSQAGEVFAEALAKELELTCADKR
jgi:lipoate-protein ligase B